MIKVMSNIKTTVTESNQVQIAFDTGQPRPILVITDSEDAREFARYLLDACSIIDGKVYTIREEK